MKINNLAPAIARPELVQGSVASSRNEDFGKMLMDVLKEINASQSEAKQMQNSFLTGQPDVEFHDFMIAMEKASVGMQLTLQVRNKVLEAYQEINRINI